MYGHLCTKNLEKKDDRGDDGEFGESEGEEMIGEETEGDVPVANVITGDTIVQASESDKTSADCHNSVASDISCDDVPTNYIFPSFFVFVTRGPFVPPDKRLPLTLVADVNKKKGSGSRAEQRRQDSKDGKKDAAHDTTATRGFSTEQRIDIENLKVRKQSLMDRQRESTMVGLSIEEAALSRQIESAERRAGMRCPIYDASNVHWKRVDTLVDEQDKVLQRIRNFNENKSKPPPTVSDFLNSASPEK